MKENFFQLSSNFIKSNTKNELYLMNSIYNTSINNLLHENMFSRMLINANKFGENMAFLIHLVKNKKKESLSEKSETFT